MQQNENRIQKQKTDKHNTERLTKKRISLIFHADATMSAKTQEDVEKM